MTQVTNTPDAGWMPARAVGEELFSLLRRISGQYVAFYIPFSPPVGYKPRTPGLTAPRILKIGMFYLLKFAIVDLYIPFKFGCYVNTLLEL
jgi:hypothetical protein